MIIYLDFDGTLVEHCYPLIGKINPRSFNVVEKLKNAGHTIVLNTYRADCDDGTLELSVYFIERNPYYDLKLDSIQSSKIMPLPWKTPHKNMISMYIDDISPGIPLRDGFHVDSKMVDWQQLDKLFDENGIY